MKLSVSAYRAQASAHKKILTSSYQQHYGSTSAPPLCSQRPQFTQHAEEGTRCSDNEDISDQNPDSRILSTATSREDDDDSSNNYSNESKSPGQRTKSNQRWMKLRTTVQLSSAIQKKPPLKREDSFLKRFSTRQIPETQETVEDTGSEGATGDHKHTSRHRRRKVRVPRSVVNPDENFYFYWLWLITLCVLYNLWTLIVRQSFPELQIMWHYFWLTCDGLSDVVFALDLVVQLRTGYLEQGLMVYDTRKLAVHYLSSRPFLLDIASLTPLDLLQLKIGTNPIIRFPRFFKVYRAIDCYYIVESRTVYPNFWRVINLIHILLILAHWFGCFYFLLSEAEGFQGDWVYPHRPGDYATLTRKYLGSLYWSTLTLTTIGDLPTPETNAEYVFTIVSYLIGVFIFATIVGQVGNVITNRNANRLEFERLLDGAKTYMRHHKVPGGMKRRVLRWYDYSWSRGRIQGGGDINTALGLLPDKLKTELALHVNLSVLKKVTIFQECQPEFLHDLVLKMKAYIFTPGDSICRKGEVAREMFIIADGILEVISETGRVLTTMKAGDFFGEIGILNLDGLNKRTADVRSVGYSELFSLSREDVLAAMKDYPEAQDILQTLGRKRLQEAKNMSRQRTKKGDLSPDKLGDDSTSKRIVHKIRSDVKGLRNAIRSRSRIRRGTDGDKMLRRMNRVNSDDEHHHHEDGETTSGSKDGEKEKCISPIGAGLPLLSRLKLLKEKQDREEKAAKQRHSTTSITSIHPQPSTSATVDAEPEVIGAGLPLLQRLLLLKAKEEREKNQLTPTNSNQPSSSETISPISVKSPLSPTIKNISPIRKGSGSTSPGKLQSPTTRTSRKNSSGSSDGNSKPKVSFKDKILQVQSDGTAVCQPLNKDLSEKPAALVEPTPKTESNSISIPHSVVSKIKSPAKIGTTFRDKLKMLQTGNKEPETEKKIIPPEKCTVEIIPLQINDNKEENISKKPWIKLKKASILGESKSQSKCSVDSEKSSPSETTPTGDLVKLDNNNKEKTNEVFQNPKICLTTPLEPVHEKTLDLMSLSPKQHTTRVIDLKSTSMLQPKPKNYRSIDDLSPEYGGLPFVKKLKILNERQKLAELEKVVKHRSSSLDYTSSSEELLSDTLTRSLSEGSTMDKRKYKRKSTDSVSSYESNETLERRTLKSILKKLSEESPAASPERSSEFKRLIRAPTIEGYAARHSKFSKSVTFHRHTLPSPPSSAPPNSNLSTFSLPEPAPPEISQEETENQIIKEAIIETSIDLKEYEFKQISDPIYNFRPEEIRVPEKPKLSLISAVANQRKLLRSSLEDQEYFGEVLLGIKQVIQGHLHDVQGKFQDRFNSLENEVKKRDEIISQLQKRIQELERVGGLPKSDQHDTDGHDSDAGKESSFSGDVSPSDEGFMRGDSLDTVFATSPPTVTEEPTTKEEEITDAKLAEITKDISLTELSYTELASLAESLDDKSTKDSWSASKCKRLDLNLDGKAGTYARKRAEKIKRKSWDDGSRDCYEMQRIRPLSPQSSEDRSLLSPESSLRSNRRRPFPFLDSTRSKIKKTLSVDTGMHHTGIKDGKPTVRGPRKFSLGSIFGYSKPTAQKLKQNCNDVVLDIGSDCSWSDSTSTCSSDSELPLAPGFEEFARRTTDYDASPTEVCSGGDWEVMMLAQELQRREKESKRKNTLKDLEEECDTPREESFDSNQDYSNSSSTQLLTQPIEVAQVETSFVNRQTVRNRVRSLGDYSPGTSRSETRGLVLRASSLESETTKTIEDNQKKL